MQTPHQVQPLIDHELALLQADPVATVLPAAQLSPYDAFGPTFASSSPRGRIDRIRRGTSSLASADRVQARLALLTANHVPGVLRERHAVTVREYFYSTVGLDVQSPRPSLFPAQLLSSRNRIGDTHRFRCLRCITTFKENEHVANRLY